MTQFVTATLVFFHIVLSQTVVEKSEFILKDGKLVQVKGEKNQEVPLDDQFQKMFDLMIQ